MYEWTIQIHRFNFSLHQASKRTITLQTNIAQKVIHSPQTHWDEVQETNLGLLFSAPVPPDPSCDSVRLCNHYTINSVHMKYDYYEFLLKIIDNLGITVY